MKKNIKIIVGVAVIAIFGISTFAIADWGHGHGRMMGPDGSGQNWHNRNGYGYGQDGYNSNLTADEIAKIDKQRSDFIKATEDIRQELYKKDLALKSEMAKEKPDVNVASGLQQEISKLEGELDQKRLDYEIQARNIAPNYSRNNRGSGQMMGYGYRGGRNCMW